MHAVVLRLSRSGRPRRVDPARGGKAQCRLLRGEPADPEAGAGARLAALRARRQRRAADAGGRVAAAPRARHACRMAAHAARNCRDRRRHQGRGEDNRDPFHAGARCAARDDQGRRALPQHLVSGHRRRSCRARRGDARRAPGHRAASSSTGAIATTRSSRASNLRSARSSSRIIRWPAARPSR